VLRLGGGVFDERRTRTGPDWVKLGRTIRYIADDLNWRLDQRCDE